MRLRLLPLLALPLLSLLLCAGLLLSVGLLGSGAPPLRAAETGPERPPAPEAGARTDAPLAIDGAWEQVSLPVTTTYSYHFSVHPAEARTLLVASYAGLFRSGDAGETWNPVTVTVDSYITRNFLDVIYAPSSPDRIYLDRYVFDHADANLLRSDDGGTTWRGVAATAVLCDLTVAPSDADRLYARHCDAPQGDSAFARSKDGGATWEAFTLPYTDSVSSFAVAPADPNLLVMAGDSGVFRSSDGARTWVRVLEEEYVYEVAFQSGNPHWVFAGGWNGLFRSRDDGLTWQKMNAPGWGYQAMATWPRTGGSLAVAAAYGGTDYHSLYQTTAAGWTRKAWSVPEEAHDLRRSFGDDGVLYARAQGNTLWRYIAVVQPLAHVAFLPSISGLLAPPPHGSTPDAAAALARTNQFRTLVGLAPLVEDPRITQAAASHARYTVINSSDDAAWANGPHGEVPGKPGFTGENPSARCKAAGFEAGCGEVKSYRADPVGAIDGWIATVYHRLPLIDPSVTVAGYGRAEAGNARADVLDWARVTVGAGIWLPVDPYLWVYPIPGQTGVPTFWWGYENPDPLPPGASHPVGYPVTIEGEGATLAVQEATLREAGGALVAVHPNADACAPRNCHALVPVARLKPQTTYTVFVRATLGGVSVVKSWSFTTGEDDDNAAAADLQPPNEGRALGPPLDAPGPASAAGPESFPLPAAAE